MKWFKICCLEKSKDPKSHPHLLTRNSSNAARSSPPESFPLWISYHCRTGDLASDGSSLTIGCALARPRNSGSPYNGTLYEVCSNMNVSKQLKMSHRPDKVHLAHPLTFFQGSKYLLPSKISSSKLDLLGSKIMITNDSPTPNQLQLEELMSLMMRNSIIQVF